MTHIWSTDPQYPLDSLHICLKDGTVVDLETLYWTPPSALDERYTSVQGWEVAHLLVQWLLEGGLLQIRRGQG
jgi:hypothetical protein